MRLALPKGRLLEPLLAFLAERGITFTFANDRDYRPACNLPDIDAKLIKARDVPEMLFRGKFQAGFTCLDAVREANRDNVVAELPLWVSRGRVVAAAHRSLTLMPFRIPGKPLTIVTEYPRLARAWAETKGIAEFDILPTSGSSEAYPPEDGDVVVDVVGTGATLEANGLILIDELFPTCTYFVISRRGDVKPEDAAAVEELTNRLE